MKKERHPIYRLIVLALVLMLALGVLFLLRGLKAGPEDGALLRAFLG